MAFYWKKEKVKPRVSVPLDFRLRVHQEKFPNIHETTWWSVIIVLRDSSIDEFLRVLGTGFAKDLLIPDDYDLRDRLLREKVQQISCFATSSLLRVLNEKTIAPMVSGITLGMVVMPEHLAFDVSPEQDTNSKIEVPAGTVLTAIIDDGIAFAHNLFRNSLLSSRVVFANILATPIQRDEARTSVGRILDKSKIDRLLAQNTYCGLLDEEKFYKDAGLFNAFEGTFASIARRKSHGSHVMGLASGYEMGTAPSNRPILCALLPSLVTEDSTGQNLLPSLHLALKRLTRQAGRFILPDGCKPPVVFNLSYGNFSGPHDGTGNVELEFEKYFAEPGDQLRRLVLPVGNGNLSRTHGEIPCDDGKQHLDLLVHPSDRTPSFVEMWMPYAGDAPLPTLADVTVTDPTGESSGPVSTSEEYDQVMYNEQGNEVARLAYHFAKWPTERGVIILSTAPTASLSSVPLAPAGQWQIDITPVEVKKSEFIKVWVARDETIPGFRPGGRQSYFNNPDYVRFNALGGPLPVDPSTSDSQVQRAGTQSGIATGASPLVVAGFVEFNRLLADYSAAGPVTAARDDEKASRCGPDAAAKSDASPAVPGVLSAGTHSGSMMRMNGTSVAAPRVARLTVEAIAQGAPGDRAWLWKVAEETAYSPVGEEKPAVTRTGGGQLDIPVPFDRV